MKYNPLSDQYSEDIIETLDKINRLSKRCNLPKFEIKGKEKSNKWYKNIFRKPLTFECIIETKNSEYKFVIFYDKDGDDKFYSNYCERINKITIRDKYKESSTIKTIMNWFTNQYLKR